jgi:hypothetical protein
VPHTPPAPNSHSPFLDRFDVDKLLALAIKKLEKGGVQPLDGSMDCYSYVLAIIDALSVLVGTERPADYKLNWPYRPEEILENVYLRLRIGPTFFDLLRLCQRIHRTLAGSELEQSILNAALSVTLDALIDQGALVPTFANYEGKTFRIYRRGEAPGQDAVDAVLFAFAAYPKPLSVTRLAKILSVLSYSEKYHELLESSAKTRGCVGAARRTVLGAEPDNIATYLRNTGQITNTHE